jgi:hypothetical protein
MNKQAFEKASRKNIPELSERGELWWRIRVLPESNESAIVGRLTEQYNVSKAHEEAQREGDPLLSPHGHFRSLARGNRGHAIEFLEKFGPLVKGQEEKIIRVDLATFWMEQRRFLPRGQPLRDRDNRKGLRRPSTNISASRSATKRVRIARRCTGFEDSKRKLREEWLKHGARTLTN